MCRVLVTFPGKFEVSQCEGAASAGGSTLQVSLQPSKGAKRAGAWAETSPRRSAVPPFLSKDSRAGLVMVTRVSRESSDCQTSQQGWGRSEARPGSQVGVGVIEVHGQAQASLQGGLGKDQEPGMRLLPLLFAWILMDVLRLRCVSAGCGHGQPNAWGWVHLRWCAWGQTARMVVLSLASVWRQHGSLRSSWSWALGHAWVQLCFAYF